MIYGSTEVKKRVIRYAVVHHDTIGLAGCLQVNSCSNRESPDCRYLQWPYLTAIYNELQK